MRTSKEIGQQIRQIRKNKPMNLTAFAKQIGVNKSTLSRYENGSRKIPMEDIEIIARELNVTPERLIFAEQARMDSIKNELTEKEWEQVISFAEDILKQHKR